MDAFLLDAASAFSAYTDKQVSRCALLCPRRLTLRIVNLRLLTSTADLQGLPGEQVEGGDDRSSRVREPANNILASEY